MDIISESYHVRVFITVKY